MIEYARLIASFDVQQFQTMMLIADDCDDRGVSEEAAGWRWMARHERFPKVLSAVISSTATEITWEWCVVGKFSALPDRMPEQLQDGIKTKGFKENFVWRGSDLGLLLQTTAKFLGKMLALKKIPEDWRNAPKPETSGRRKFADMPQDEREARQAVSRARRNLRLAEQDPNNGTSPDAWDMSALEHALGQAEGRLEYILDKQQEEE